MLILGNMFDIIVLRNCIAKLESRISSKKDEDMVAKITLCFKLHAFYYVSKKKEKELMYITP